MDWATYKTAVQNVDGTKFLINAYHMIMSNVRRPRRSVKMLRNEYDVHKAADPLGMPEALRPDDKSIMLAQLEY